MSDPGALALLGLAAWGVVVAVDLVSVPQALLARPLVAATMAGWLAGDVGAGLRVGVALELFALEVLPVGAARYPDYGPGAVAGAVVAAGASADRLGLGVATGLVLAVMGGWSLGWLRRENGEALRRRLAALAAGEAGAVRALQLGGLARDAVRGLALTLAGLAVALPLRHAAVPPAVLAALTAAAIGAGLVAAGAGALRSAGRGARFGWLVAGLGAGSLLMLAVR